MDLNFNQADIDFRNEVRDFIKTSYTSEMKAEISSTVQSTVNYGYQVKVKYGFIGVLPFVKEGGVIKKVTSFQLNYNTIQV